MNTRLIFFALRQVMKILALCMLIPLIFAVFVQEFAVVKAFAVTILIVMVCVAATRFLQVEKKNFYAREGFVVVALAWIVISFFGAVALRLSGSFPSFVDAFFESVSGFTTTGSTVIDDITVLPKSILLWRCFTQWLGGMGVLVFLIAVLPMTGGRMQHLMRAESPGPSPGKLVPKMRDTASILYFIYAGLTLLEIIILILGKMPVFDSVLLAFSTAATGGFGVSFSSIAAYGNPFAEWVIMIFMVLFGINFQIFFLLLLKKFKAVLTNEEVLWYLGIVLASTVLIGLNIHHQYQSLEETARVAGFQVASIITTTGFASADFNQWPYFSQCLLVLLMFFGGCAGSASGGIKIVRIVLMFKIVKRQIKRILHPKSVSIIRMDRQTVEEETVNGISAYMLAYILILLASFLLLSINGLSFEVSMTAAISSLNNIGPGLGMIGPMESYSGLSALSKIILSFNMLIGRLEIFPILILFAPSVWRNR